MYTLNDTELCMPERRDRVFPNRYLSTNHRGFYVGWGPRYLLVRSTPSTCFVKMGETCPTACNSSRKSVARNTLIRNIYSVYN